MPQNKDFKDVGGIDEPNKNEQTPESKKSGNTSDSAASPAAPESPDQDPENQTSPIPGSNTSGKKTRYKGKGVDANGRPRNFYNPPGKVLRSLANQSYYDSFYGNQG